MSHVRDVDGYRGAVAGVDIEAIRAGRGGGPNSVTTAMGDDVTFTACGIGFPILTRTTVADDRVLVAVIRSAPPGSRWCEIDLSDGQTLAYGPGAEHHATNKEGLRFAFAITRADILRARAEQLGTALELPGRGEVYSNEHRAQRNGRDRGPRPAHDTFPRSPRPTGRNLMQVPRLDYRDWEFKADTRQSTGVGSAESG